VAETTLSDNGLNDGLHDSVNSADEDSEPLTDTAVPDIDSVELAVTVVAADTVDKPLPVAVCVCDALCIWFVSVCVIDS